jgi:hypothetical protein
VRGASDPNVQPVIVCVRAVCWMVTQRLKSGSGGRRGEDYISDKVCRSLSGDDKTAVRLHPSHGPLICGLCLRASL